MSTNQQTLPVPGTRENAVVARAWRVTAWIGGVFTLLVGIGMVVAHLKHKSSDPWRSPVLLDLKAELVSEPRNEELKQQIRELDLGLRTRYFHFLSLKSTAVYMSFSGALVLVYAGNRVRLLQKLPPMPQPDPEAAARLARQAHLSRNAIAVCSGVALIAFSVLAFTGPRSPLADPVALQLLTGDDRPVAAPVYTVAVDELRTNWCRFRGHQGSGVARNGIDLTASPIVVWQVPASSPGFNSPLVWRDRLLFTGGNHEMREVLCLNATSGELDWRQPVELPAPPAVDDAPEIPEMTGHAASTAATDGERIYAIFATGELVAFTLDGQLVWSKHLGVFDNPYGHAASLACWKDQVIVQLDQGDEDSRKSKIIAFDGRTGEMTWQKARLVGASWVTPIIIDVADKPQVITLGLPWVVSYAASDGAELWRAKSLEGEITPSPVFGNGLLFIVDPGMYQLLAFRPDGSGDVTETHEVWRVDGEMPDITSPVSNGDQVFTLTSDGTLSCFDTSTGAELWKKSLEADGEIQASPVLAADVLLLVSTAGDLIAVEAANEFRELWRMQLDDEFYASPAFANGRMYLRGNRSVWCLTGSGMERARR
jgi:outer membrane protein assembly factor BamB